MIGLNTGYPSDWEEFIRKDVSGFQSVHKPLWFTKTYTDNSTTTLNFFDAALAADDLFTNIFPYANPYLIKAIGVYILANMGTDDQGAAAAELPSVIDDIQLLVNTGVLDIKVGKGDVGPFPLWRLAAGGGVWGGVAAAGGEAANLVTDFGQLGMPHPDAIFKLAKPIYIPASSPATFRMRWPSGAVNLVGNRTIKLLLEGLEGVPAAQ